MFTLHPRLAADTAFVGRLDLCCALLMEDRRYPWLILVPERPDVTELHALSRADQGVLMGEITAASSALQRLTEADRINVGMLGNLVPQLHIHVIARRRDDPAWPGPVWGHSPAEPYAPAARAQLIKGLHQRLVLSH